MRRFEMPSKKASSNSTNNSLVVAIDDRYRIDTGFFRDGGGSGFDGCKKKLEEVPMVKRIVSAFV